MTQLDWWMPAYDVHSTHAIEISAPPERVYTALLDLDLQRVPLARLLMRIRSIPALLLAPRRTWRRMRAAGRALPPALRAGLERDFVVLEERPRAEIVLGLTGRFWTPSGGLRPTDPSTFRDPVPDGLAQAAWNFLLRPHATGTLLSTETRVRCGGPRTTRRFRWYWAIIAPGSGWLRRAVLRHIKRLSEAT